MVVLDEVVDNVEAVDDVELVENVEVVVVVDGNTNLSTKLSNEQ